ncbi:RagB/SusD family nutrient uptake outer membrane protein [Parapedobacter tibetensis]|uniref:RagB/SusD family nutrient uptake outer membrane protein n=1 Tax=Parapedobacter tibetensis TaxID=2972951 RepID=UPI00214DD890|nr:RagB/SusD family nutrient uptake outer membrane protein [Parapedobacter tibetensis]
MKTNNIYIALLALTIGGGFTSCEKFLEREPLSTLAPETYLTEASQLQAYADDSYPRILPSSSGNSYGIFAQDQGTDNQISTNAPSRFATGLWRVPNSGGDWSFQNIYRLNFFFSMVNPRYGDDLGGAQNTISGNLADVQHYIGEMYFLRALEYFSRYRQFGDFPIITEPLADDLAVLTKASRRSPRNEVARFILSDLDKAITLLAAKDMATTRINRDVALLLKSRVALHEGTWLKYFKGTAFVPNGDGWPGKVKDYNANYQFPGGSIDSEIDFFLGEAMSASREVSEKYKNTLTQNTGALQQATTEPANPYFNMFGSENLSSVPEVLLWRQYALGILGHDVALAANQGNWGVGVTRGYVQNFLMADGTPVYANGTYADGNGYYMGDKTIRDVRANRDSRLSLFLKEPGQHNILVVSQTGLNINYEEPIPNITTGDAQRGYTTGYALRKGGNFDTKYHVQNQGYTGIIIYRAAEALLNYMEASYERNGSLDASAREYWQIIRRRAHVGDDIDATIAATDMGREAGNDWGAYSAGQVLTDKTLYNIRRERRSEFISEGLRYIDLCRWRAMDQLIAGPYIPEGFHLWNTPMESWYTDLRADGTDNANVSSPALSEYLRPYQRNANQLAYNGFTWKMAHYLTPIAINQFLLTAPDGQTVSDSPIYQNPYWPAAADQPAME